MTSDPRGAAPPRSAEPRAFVREIEVPPGAPWTQQRIALLDAEAGAPAALEMLLLAAARAGRWRFGQPACFAVGYARRQEAPGGLVAEHLIAGRKVVLRFEPEPVRAARRRRTGALWSAGALAASLVIAAGAESVRRRAVGEAELERAEDHAQLLRRRAGLAERARREAAAVQTAGLEGAPLSVAAGDLARVDAERIADVPVLAVHWRPGTLIFETHGPRAPLDAEPELEPVRVQTAAGRRVWSVTTSTPRVDHAR